ncbi:FkbM family methyltransferase [Microbulbifer sp. ZKSA004]|uniref:FkbM family methyltransferase n=1 Tax=Microbulbifer sp. ZKSA004 TaxID=3243389 RepID=UPI00403A26E7
MTFVSYAQNLEDVILWRALKDVDRGFYIDVGANDPHQDSVTKAFYERGWKGINIEPVSQWFLKLKKERPLDINLQVAAGSREGEIQLYELPDTGLSTASREFADKHRLERGYKYLERTVLVRTLSEICSSYHVTQIHFLKVDVEGAEKQVLDGMNFSFFRPWIVVVESTLPNSQVEDYESWESILTNADYDFVYFDGLNRYYLAGERQSLKPNFRLPPNCFDEFTFSGSQIFCQASERKADKIFEEKERLSEEKERLSEEKERILEEKRQREGELSEARLQIQSLQAANDERSELAERYQNELHSIYGSRSWLVTWPLRIFSDLLRYLLKSVKRVLQDSLMKFIPLANRFPVVRRFISILRSKFPSIHQQLSQLVGRSGQLVDENGDDVSMKVILDVESVQGNLTGIGRYSYELAVRLPREVSADVRYWNGSSFQENISSQEDGHKQSFGKSVVLRLSYFKRKLVNLLPTRLKDLIKNTLRPTRISVPTGGAMVDSDYIFHGPNFFLPDHLGKKVVTIHDLSIFRFPEYHPEERVKFMSSEVPKAIDKADAIIAISEFTKQELLHYFPIAEGKVHVVPNGANKPVKIEYTKRDSEVLEGLLLSKGNFFLCVSTIEPRKNLSLLLHAYLKLANDIRKENPLVLVGGDGWKSEQLMEQIQLAREENVHYLGYVDQHTLEALYKSAKAFVFPSLYEGFGLPAIEAMGYGLPVVCASNTAVSEVCAGDALEFSGCSAEDLTAILERLATESALRQRLSEASKQRANEYSWERCSRETVAVYKSVLGQTQ